MVAGTPQDRQMLFKSSAAGQIYMHEAVELQG